MFLTYLQLFVYIRFLFVYLVKMAYFGFSRDYRTKCHVIQIVLLVVCYSRCYCQMNGFRVESSVDGVALSTSVDTVGRQSVVGGNDIVIRIFSTEPLPVGSQLSFTTDSASQDVDCTDMRSSAIFDLVFGSGQDESSAKATVRLATDPAVYMFCLRRWQNSSSSWRHQGNSSWLQLAVTRSVSSPSTLPLWAHIVIILALVAVSSMCTGLAVVVLSVSRADLKILRSCGVSEERRFVKAVAPLRKKANRVICGLLFTALFANAAIAVLIEDLMNIPGAAMIISAVVVMLFCIILPMIVSSKISLDFAAKSAWLANVVVVVTFFVSYPFGQLFDWIMSDDLPCVVDRTRLQCLQQSSVQANVASKDDDKDDARGGGGTFKNLALSTKCVKDLMIPMSGVFMVEYNDVLDEKNLGGILASGFTRIPVYEKDPTNIVAVLHVRDLAYVHASDRTLLRTLCKFYNHPVNFVFEDTKLDVMLEEFKKGQSHMAFVQRVNCEGAGDPFYETLGMITLEDVIEGIFESEAIVEIQPDLIRDNSLNTTAPKAVKTENSKTSAFTRLKHQLGGSLGTNVLKELSTQLESVVCQFLSTLRPFREEVMSQNIISRMLKQNVVLKIDIESSTPAQRQLYEFGTPSDCFTLIVEGHVKIRVGQDGFVFDGGPFMYFGLGALLPEIEVDGRSSETSDQHSKVMAKQGDAPPVNGAHRVQYVPDYTVECSTNVLLVRVTAAQYRLALRAAALEFHIQTTQEVTSEMDIFAMIADGNVSSSGGGASDAGGGDHDYNAMDDGDSFASAKSRSQLLERRARGDDEC